MLVQMLIAEMRSREAFAKCAAAYVEHVVPQLEQTEGLQHAYFAGEDGESLLVIVTLLWTSREAALIWSNTGNHRRLVATLCTHSVGDVVTKFFRVEHESGNVGRHIQN